MTDSENIKVVPAPRCQNCKFFTFWGNLTVINNNIAETKPVGHCMPEKVYSGYVQKFCQGLVADDFYCDNFECIEKD